MEKYEEYGLPEKWLSHFSVEDWKKLVSLWLENLQTAREIEEEYGFRHHAQVVQLRRGVRNSMKNNWLFYGKFKTRKTRDKLL